MLRLRSRLRGAAAAWGLGCACGAALAGPASLLDASERALRDDLAWLADRGRIGISLGTWPLPRAVIDEALAGLGTAGLDAADADALRRVRSALARLAPGVAAGAAWNSAAHPSIGSDGTVRARAETSLRIQGEGAEAPVAWRLRARVQKERIARDPSPLGFDGSYVAGRWRDTVVTFGAVDRHWGPGRHGSLLLGDAGPPVPGLIVRRATERAPEPAALAWLGAWTYEVSIGRPSHYTPRGPTTLGIRIAARPMPGVELGVGRYMYWGGRGRPRNPGSLFDVLTADSNIEDAVRDGPDPGNEIAGFDIRVSADGAAGVRWAGYAQFAGDDEAQGAPSKWMALLGVQARHASAAHRWVWTAEAIDTRLGRLFNLKRGPSVSAYRHAVYGDGHYHQGLPVGAWIGGAGAAASAGVEWMPIGADDSRRYEARAWSGRVSQAGDESINAAFGTRARVDGALLQASGERPGFGWRLGFTMQRYEESARRRYGVTGAIEVPLTR